MSFLTFLEPLFFMNLFLLMNDDCSCKYFISLNIPCKFLPFYRRIDRDAELQSLMQCDWMQFSVFQ